MILVIFGAGASYDSIPDIPPATHSRKANPDRPPLANELFLNSGIFARELSKYQICAPIVPYLRDLRDGQTIESALETLQSETDGDPKRKCQLAAVRFYLHNMIWACEDAWNGVARGITNYRTLVDQLRRVRKQTEPVCLVTFNYDRMIENALSDVDIVLDSLPKYIEYDTFKLFKVHGSVHWGREVNTPVPNIRDRNIWDIGHELIQNAAQLDISDRYQLVGQRPIGRSDGVGLYPAIAIPVETKQDFECPKEHLASLREYLPKITRILVIGWRGSDQHFLNLLRDYLKKPISLCVVDKNREGVDAVEAKMVSLGHPVTVVGRGERGFSDFVRSREAEKVLRS